jgi:hypothetical protein
VAKLPEKLFLAVIIQLVVSVAVLVGNFGPASDEDAIRLALRADHVEGEAPLGRPVYLQVPVSFGVGLRNGSPQLSRSRPSGREKLPDLLIEEASLIRSAPVAPGPSRMPRERFDGRDLHAK